MKKTATFIIGAGMALSAVSVNAQYIADQVKTQVNYDRSRYARGVLLTGITESRDTEGHGALAAVPANVRFYYTTSRRGMTYIGSLATSNGRTNIRNLGFTVPTSPLDDDVKIYVQWIPTVATFLYEPDKNGPFRIPIGT